MKVIGPGTVVEGGELMVFEDEIGDTYVLPFVVSVENLEQIVDKLRPHLRKEHILLWWQSVFPVLNITQPEIIVHLLCRQCGELIEK